MGGPEAGHKIDKKLVTLRGELDTTKEPFRQLPFNLVPSTKPVTTAQIPPH